MNIWLVDWSYAIINNQENMFSKLARGAARTALASARAALSRTLLTPSARMPLSAPAAGVSAAHFSGKPKISEAVMVLQEKLSGISQVVGLG